MTGITGWQTSNDISILHKYHNNLWPSTNYVRREPKQEESFAYFISPPYIYFMNHIGQIYHISKHSAMGWYWSSRVINKNLQDYESCKCSLFFSSPLPLYFISFTVLLMCVCQLDCCRYSHWHLIASFRRTKIYTDDKKYRCWCLENKWIACIHFMMQFLWVII